MVVAAVILAALTSWAMWTLDIGRPDGRIPVPEPVPVVVGFDATG